MKKFYLILLMILLSFTLIACAKSKKTLSPYYYVRIAINPEIDFVVNSDRLVVKMMPLNADAEILIANEHYLNQPIKDVVSDVIENALFTGYLDPDSYMQAVAIGVGHQDSTLEARLKLALMEAIQDTLDSLALEAFIVNTEVLNNDVMELIDTHNLSLGHALLLDTYQKNHPEKSLDALLTLSYNTLIESSITDFTTFYATYKSESEVGKALIKDMLISDNAYVLSTRDLEAFEPADRSGDLGTFIENVVSYVDNRSEVNTKRVSNAENLIKGSTPSFLAGEYSYELSSERMPYQILSHFYTLNANGTYTESFLWQSWDLPQTVSGTDHGTWEVIEQKLILTNQGNFKTEFRILPSRLVRLDKIGFNRDILIDVYFKNYNS